MNCLGDLLLSFNAISLVGMSKNAGKTTVLNYLLQYFNKKNLTLAITSIGRDGEATDIVTGTKKPKIYVPQGSVVVTAERLLELSDITCEILACTEFTSPLGRIIIVRAKSSGFVQIGGAQATGWTLKIMEYLKDFAIDKMLIDGAINRKSISNPILAKAVVLCTGASLSSNIDTVVQKTKFAAKIMCLPQIKPDSYDCVPNDTNIHLKGAVTDTIIKTLLFSGKDLNNRHIICDDPSKILISQETYEKLQARGGELYVKNPVNLVAITVNPLSHKGFSLPKEEFLRRMSDAVDLPVFDVV